MALYIAILSVSTYNKMQYLKGETFYIFIWFSFEINVKIEKLRLSVRNLNGRKETVERMMKYFKCYDGLRMLK